MELESDSSLQKVNNDLKKFGIRKYIWLSFLKYLFPIMIAVIGVGASHYFTDKKLDSVVTQISEIEVDNTATANITTGENESTLVLGRESSEVEQRSENSKSFNEENWNWSKTSLGKTKDGYYCPNKPGYRPWTAWTKDKRLLESPTKIKFKLRDKTTKNNKPPTLYLTYGDKTNDIPEQFYRFNIFDGDLRTIGQYDSNDDKNSQDWLTEEPTIELSEEFIFELNPSIPNPDHNRVSLNPSLSFRRPDDSTYEYKPKPDKNLFSTGVPYAKISEEVEGQHMGLGVSKGDCFKIISSNLE